MEVHHMERWLSPNLGYDPDDNDNSEEEKQSAKTPESQEQDE